MSEHKIGAVPILDGDRLVGIFSERDLMVRCVAGRLDLEKTKIDDDDQALLLWKHRFMKNVCRL
jgi:CBS domain-containing protein